MADLNTQVRELEKKVKQLSQLLVNDNFGRETIFTRLLTIAQGAIFRIVPNDASVTTNARYGEVYVDQDLVKWLDSSGTERSGGNFPAQELTASGAVLSDVSYVELNDTTPLIAATIAAPAAGRFLVITQTDTGTAGHTVTLTAGTYDGTNTIATFNAQYETLVLFGVSATRFIIIENVGAVALS